MKELNGRVKEWNEEAQAGIIQGDDGEQYLFGKNQWAEERFPEIGGSVRVICQNGRDASRVEYIPIEQMPTMEINVYSPQGDLISSEKKRFIRLWRLRSDALAWMMAAKSIHAQASQNPIDDISGLLLKEHLPISLRGSVVKYCYGMAIELYMKWLLTEAKIDYRHDHGLRKLRNKLPKPVLEAIRGIYSNYQKENQPSYRIMEAHAHGADELALDWSSFDNFVENLDSLKFILGRYAVPSDYSIFATSSEKLSKEMNAFMDSDDFFELGDRVLSHIPNLCDYE